MNIKIDNLTFSYNNVTNIFDNLSLSIKDGECVSIIGHNGSGKSTLAKLIMGLLPFNKGSIYLNNTPLNESTVDSLRNDMAMIFQNPDNQFVGVTVEDDVAFGLENRCIETNEMNEIINQYLTKVDMIDYKKCNPEELSGGQKQRVAIAGALALKSDLLIFDESTSMLDPECSIDVLNLIKDIKDKEHKTIIMITHNLNEVLLSDRVIVLNNGSVALDDIPENVFKNDKLLEACNLKNIDSLTLLNELKGINYHNKSIIEDTIWKLNFKK